ncbi:hypothetical protein Mapa_005856 [Marchantia paleacea]|nr:hypothetical protein Mapa_005856 [Marchantia paleacea]
MRHPSLSVLFAGTFRHHLPGDHVDEVRFDEPVIISAIEIMDLHAPQVYESLSVYDGDSPQAFPVDIFFRSGGDECFKRLSHPFLYYSSAPPLLDQDVEATEDDYGSYWNLEVAETDHLVLRGTHDCLTMILYGN